MLMRRNPPSQNTTAHWGLYALAAYETDNMDSPRATVDDVWDATGVSAAFAKKHDLKQALRKLNDREVPTVTDYEYSYLDQSGRERPYAYRLTDVGKRALQRLELPTETPDGDLASVPHDDLPVAAFRETGLGEPDNRARPPRLPAPSADEEDSEGSEECTDLRPLDSSLPVPHEEEETAVVPVSAEELTPVDSTAGDHVFVDETPALSDGARHIYVPNDDGSDTLIPKCGAAGVNEPETLEFTPATQFEQAADACDHCLSGTELVRATGDVGDDSVEALPEQEFAGALESGKESLPAARSVEPDWQWLAVSLANAGRDDLAERAVEQDLSPDELYGEVLEVLYNERSTLAATQTPPEDD